MSHNFKKAFKQLKESHSKASLIISVFHQWLKNFAEKTQYCGFVVLDSQRKDKNKREDQRWLRWNNETLFLKDGIIS